MDVGREASLGALVASRWGGCGMLKAPRRAWQNPNSSGVAAVVCSVCGPRRRVKTSRAAPKVVVSCSCPSSPIKGNRDGVRR